MEQGMDGVSSNFRKELGVATRGGPVTSESWWERSHRVLEQSVQSIQSVQSMKIMKIRWTDMVSEPLTSMNEPLMAMWRT